MTLAHRTSGSSPWAADDLLRTLGTVGIGLAASATAWWLASDEEAIQDQVRWANLSVAGFVVGSYGMVLWLLRGRRAVGARRRDLLGSAAPASVVETLARSERLVAGPGLTKYHRDDCAFAVGRPWPSRTASAHEAEGREPCGMCRP